MKKFISSVRNFLQDETGATAIEYGLMVGLIAAILIVVVTALGKSVFNLFADVCNALKDATTGSSVTCPAKKA